jgi:hypothetical protein
VRFQVLTAARMKMDAFRDIVLTASIIRVMMEVVRVPETSVYSNEITQHYIAEGLHLYLTTFPLHLTEI